MDGFLLFGWFELMEIVTGWDISYAYKLTLTGDALKRLVYVKEESLSQINSFVFICSIFA